MTITVLTVDDHPPMRDGIAAMIPTQTDVHLVAEEATGGEVHSRFRERLLDAPGPTTSRRRHEPRRV
jgi:hypothetical protein